MGQKGPQEALVKSRRAPGEWELELQFPQVEEAGEEPYF